VQSDNLGVRIIGAHAEMVRTDFRFVIVIGARGN